VPIPRKTTIELVKAMDVVIQTYHHQYKHIVKHFTTDDEANLKATLPHLLIGKITQSTTPADLHEKKSERCVQKIKSRLSAIKAGLSYVLPQRLVSEAIMAIVDQLNSYQPQTMVSLLSSMFSPEKSERSQPSLLVPLESFISLAKMTKHSEVILVYSYPIDIIVDV
jgi:hypothetical protein